MMGLDWTNAPASSSLAKEEPTPPPHSLAKEESPPRPHYLLENPKRLSLLDTFTTIQTAYASPTAVLWFLWGTKAQKFGLLCGSVFRVYGPTTYDCR